MIFDLDGTLINVNSITHLVGDWDAFHEATMACPPHKEMVEFARLLQKSVGLIVCTGKPAAFYNRVVDYLRLQGVMPDALIMRPPLNMQPDGEMKIAAMQRHFGDDWRDRVMFAVDDRDKMVEAWRAAGVVCLQCAPSLY